mmetsp:Transcript_12633/g.50500  ORF Transcript_12633/g.50500 Transcript_12633/m.50500 type:complete len:394 (-) Transcript_12633:42-1223(-)
MMIFLAVVESKERVLGATADTSVPRLATTRALALSCSSVRLCRSSASLTGLRSFSRCATAPLSSTLSSPASVSVSVSASVSASVSGFLSISLSVPASGPVSVSGPLSVSVFSVSVSASDSGSLSVSVLMSASISGSVSISVSVSLSSVFSSLLLSSSALPPPTTSPLSPSISLSLFVSLSSLSSFLSLSSLASVFSSTVSLSLSPRSTVAVAVSATVSEGDSADSLSPPYLVFSILSISSAILCSVSLARASLECEDEGELSSRSSRSSLSKGERMSASIDGRLLSPLLSTSGTLAPGPGAIMVPGLAARKPARRAPLPAAKSGVELLPRERRFSFDPNAPGLLAFQPPSPLCLGSSSLPPVPGISTTLPMHSLQRHSRRQDLPFATTQQGTT